MSPGIPESDELSFCYLRTPMSSAFLVGIILIASDFSVGADFRLNLRIGFADLAWLPVANF
jgi:hypothetical protein